ncbi:MAG: hypothetical protein PHY43_03500 [Verrucomicrobiales bacterium]|nr:hypothetical protein [Verrucomicrobiales bacterium]
MLKADFGQLLWEFVAEASETDADDPFLKWLRDDKSVGIDWNTFGIENFQSESPG